MAAPHVSPTERAIVRCLSHRREIQAAYVFGSGATGRVRADSDLDIAVLIDRRAVSDSLDYRLKLMADLGSALRRSDIDLVILNDASPLLVHRILSRGKLVFERSASARVRFQVRAAGRYLDLVPMFETHLWYLKKSVREGRVVG